MQNKKIKILSFIVFLIAVGLMTILVVPLIQSYDNPTEFKEFIDSYGPWGLPIMLFVQLAQIIVAIIPGELIEFVAGTLYGWFWGMIFCLVGIAIGQTIIFKAVRYFGKTFVEKFAGSKAISKFKFLQNEKQLKTVIFFLFFIPGTPKDLLTYVVPLTKISLKEFLAITLIARIPSIISSTFAGDAFSEHNYLVLTIAYSVILICSGIGILFYRYWSKKHGKKHKKNASASDSENTMKTDFPDDKENTDSDKNADSQNNQKE